MKDKPRLCYYYIYKFLNVHIINLIKQKLDINSEKIYIFFEYVDSGLSIVFKISICNYFNKHNKTNISSKSLGGIMLYNDSSISNYYNDMKIPTYQEDNHVHVFFIKISDSYENEEDFYKKMDECIIQPTILKVSLPIITSTSDISELSHERHTTSVMGDDVSCSTSSAFMLYTIRIEEAYTMDLFDYFNNFEYILLKKTLNQKIFNDNITQIKGFIITLLKQYEKINYLCFDLKLENFIIKLNDKKQIINIKFGDPEESKCHYISDMISDQRFFDAYVIHCKFLMYFSFLAFKLVPIFFEDIKTYFNNSCNRFNNYIEIINDIIKDIQKVNSKKYLIMYDIISLYNLYEMANFSIPVFLEDDDIIIKYKKLLTYLIKNFSKELNDIILDN